MRLDPGPGCRPLRHIRAGSSRSVQLNRDAPIRLPHVVVQKAVMVWSVGTKKQPEGFRIHDSRVAEPPVACALLDGKEIHAFLARLLPRRPHPRKRATCGDPKLGSALIDTGR